MVMGKKLSKMNTQDRLLFPVYEFRPLENSGKWLRWNNGNPIEDDGEYDLAFISNQHGIPIVIYVYLPWKTNLLWSWAKNGRWGAYVDKHPDGNAWHYMTSDGLKTADGWWADRSKHPNVIAGDLAMNWQSSRKGCSNGEHAEFYINNPFIAAGLLRNAETKEVVKFPEIFDCYYCGKHDWRKEEKEELIEG